MKSSSMLKASAREQLLGNYSTAVMTYAVVQFLISICLSSAESQLSLQNIGSILIYTGIYVITTLLSAVFATGENKMYYNLAHKEAFQMRDLFWAFKGSADRCILIKLSILLKTLLYGVPVLLSFLICRISPSKIFYILFGITILLWVIFALLIQIQYSQSLFLILEEPELSAKELLDKSKQIMQGQEKRYFFLVVSFFGMAILNVITFGLAIFWIHPYMTATKTNFYIDLTEKSMA